jgi:D-lactate dehydrogenase (cytochrome)
MHMSEAMTDCGGDGDATWICSDEREMERLKDFRHAVPESVNLLIDEKRKKEPGLTKLGTDLAVPDEMLEEVIALYHKGLEEQKLEYVMFGHIGNNHVHVNIIPNTLEEYDRGKALYLQWAHEVVIMGGTVSAEHGIGKLKKALLKEMYGADGIRQMQDLKRLFDPDGLLNPGNLF